MKSSKQPVEKLEQAGVRLAFLFGSHLSGRQGPEPDIDVAVLTSGRQDLDAHENLYRIFSDFFPSGKKEIDIAFMNDAPPALKLEAANGELIYECKEGFSADFKEKAMKELMDFKFHRDKFEKALMEAID